MFHIASHLTWHYRDGDTATAQAAFDTEIASMLDEASSDAVRSKISAAIGRMESDNDASREKVVVGDRSPSGYAELVGLDVDALSVDDAATYHGCWELTLAKGAAVTENMRYVEFGTWISSLNIRYFMAADGLSLPLVWLTALLAILCLAYSWNIEKATKAYFGLFLILETGLMGVFLSLDFFLFYVFWEVVLLPMYFLIGIWGGPRRVYAAIKFFIYTLVGSVLMLLCMLTLYYHAGYDTFNVLTLIEAAPTFGHDLQMWLFLGMFVGFAIKVPLFPFHTWLPDAHVQAPTAASVILAGVLLKMGGYGFFRFSFGICPDAARGDVQIPIFGNFVIFLGVLGVVNIVYGALCAMAQKDFKSLVAYSSISHMGFVLLGLAALTDTGVQGAALQMFNHGLSSAMMFFIVGVIYDRAHHRDLDRFGGIAKQMPYYTGMATVGFFASLGLPGLNGFISEAAVFLGAWGSEPAAAAAGFTPLPRMLVYLALPGIVLTAAYLLWTIQRVFMGEMKSDSYKTFPDVNRREIIALAPLGILCIILGVYPSLIMEFMDDSLSTIVQLVQSVGN